MPQRTRYDYAAIFRYIQEHPGLRLPTLARCLDANRTSLEMALIGMNNRGFLLSEDNDGHLYAWEVVGG